MWAAGGCAAAGTRVPPPPPPPPPGAGYSALEGCRVLCDSDCTPLLPTAVMNHFLLLRTANRYVSGAGKKGRKKERKMLSAREHTDRMRMRACMVRAGHAGVGACVGGWVVAACACACQHLVAATLLSPSLVAAYQPPSPHEDCRTAALAA